MSPREDPSVTDRTAEDPWEGRLSDYLDQELGEQECRALERHLEQCASCRGALDDLRTLVANAPGLKRSEPPASDLWPGVAARLQPRTSRLPWRRFGMQRAPRPLSWLAPGLATAALIVLVTAAGWHYWLSPSTPATSPEPSATHPAALDSHPDPAYEDSVAELRQAARSRLAADPQVVNVLEDNLSALDRAIAEYGEALGRNPGDEQLRQRLTEARRRKLEVLRHVTETTALGATN